MTKSNESKQRKSRKIGGERSSEKAKRVFEKGLVKKRENNLKWKIALRLHLNWKLEVCEGINRRENENLCKQKRRPGKLESGRVLFIGQTPRRKEVFL